MIAIASIPAVVLVVATVTATPAPDIDSWMGIWPGEATDQVTSERGQPLGARPLGAEMQVAYPAPNGARAYLVLFTKLGTVRRVSLQAADQNGDAAAPADPFGVSLGDNESAVRAKRGQPEHTFTYPFGVTYEYKGRRGGMWTYLFRNSKVVDITLQTDFMRPPSESPGLQRISGGNGLMRATSLDLTEAWFGARPDSQFSDFVKNNGEPLFEHRASNGNVMTWNRMSNNPNTYMTIVTHAGVIQAISVVGDDTAGALTDPFGIVIGSAQADVRASRGQPDKIETASPYETYIYHGAQGSKWAYNFKDGKLKSVELLSGHPQSTQAGSGKDDSRNGSDADTAFVIHALDTDEGLRFERYYSSQLPGCSQGWRLNKAVPFDAGAKKYHELDLTCADGKEKTVYFDVTSFYGKF